MALLTDIPAPIIHPQPRTELANMPAAIHEARDYGELDRLAIDPDGIIDFSTNANPYGPPPLVFTALKGALTQSSLLARYPDRDCLGLKAALAAAEDLSPDCLLPGNGTAELIQVIALTFVQPGSRHLILGPTFGEYERAIRLLGGSVAEQRGAAADLRLEPAATAAAIERLNPDGVWLCNPNNPTGQQWTASQLAHLQQAAPNALWVIDEAYSHFSPGSVSAWTGSANQLVLRSLTKDLALAGLRLGYVVACPAVIQLLNSVKIPWSVNSLAQVAGIAALQPESQIWRAETLDHLRQHAAHLWRRLATLGLNVLPTDTTFALIEVQQAALFRRRLLKAGLLVRDGTSFGLPNHIRVAAQLPEENTRLVETIRDLS